MLSTRVDELSSSSQRHPLPNPSSDSVSLNNLFYLWDEDPVPPPLPNLWVFIISSPERTIILPKSISHIIVILFSTQNRAYVNCSYILLTGCFVSLCFLCLLPHLGSSCLHSFSPHILIRCLRVGWAASP